MSPQNLTTVDALQIAVQHHQEGRLQQAENIYREVLAQEPHNSDALHLLGVIAHQTGNNEAAAELIEKAIQAQPNEASFHNDLGNALNQLGKWDNAAGSFRRALAIDPDFVDALNNMGVSLHRQGKLIEAAREFERAISLKPDSEGAYNNLGSVLQELHRFDEAERNFNKALSLKPDYARAHSNLGNTFMKQCRVDEAIASYKKALDYQADYKIAEFHLSNALLLKGDFQAGWKHYETRLEAKLSKEERREFSQPMWDASPLQGKTILLHAEQGIGDTFHFVRYARLAAERGGRVILECQATCKNLLETMPEIDAVFEKGQALPDFDVHAPLMSLPYILGTTLETIPNGIPYIRPPEDRTVQENFLSAEGHLKVGLVWAGSPDNSNDRNRSIPLEKFAPILQTEKVRFFSLQVGDRSGEIRSLGYQDQLEDLSGTLKDFSDTAAVLDRLDLLISVDTAASHLAGAMAKPVWTLLCFSACWRYLLDREDSPWYPTMRLFRQKNIGDWEGVIVEVKKQLDRMTP